MSCALTLTESSSLSSLCSLSIFPPDPLDKIVKDAFPNSRPQIDLKDSLGKATLYSFFYVIWILIVCVFFHTSVLAPTVLLFRADAPRWSKWLSFAMSTMSITLSLVFWISSCLYRGLGPVKTISPYHEEASEIPVDVIITTYNEDLDEIAGSLAAIQNIEWAGPIQVYVLDDASRDDVEKLIATMREARYPVTRITRFGNAGQKAGNLNNWLRNVPRTANFFVLLDCDMRPFPNILQVLFASYFDIPEHERRRFAFVQTPQFFRNYDGAHDLLDTCSMSFVKFALPFMNTISTVPFIGTGALWSRSSIESVGGFFEDTATEDVFSSCLVHTSENEFGEKYISKYLPIPVAAGIEPSTLAGRMDQHNRYSIGQAQTTVYFKFFLFCSKLRPAQRIVYLSTLGGWTRSIPSFLIMFLGGITANIFSAASNFYDGIWKPPLYIRVAIYCSMTLPVICPLLLPGLKMRETLHSMRMWLVYIPTEFAGFLHVIGVNIGYRFKSETKSKFWHPYFSFHIATYSAIVGSALLTIVAHLIAGSNSALSYLQPLTYIFFWSYAYYPVYAALRGNEAHTISDWLALEEGRNELFAVPIWPTESEWTDEKLKVV